jgi:uncharacterized membrane protein required for colicin V production
MGIIVDLVVILVVVLFIFIGYKQGLIKSAVKILSFFIAIIIALMLYKPVSGFLINNTPLGESIRNGIVNSIPLPEGVSPEDEVDIVNTLPNMIIEEGRGRVIDVAQDIMVQIIETGTLIVLFIIIKFGLRFVTVLTDLITKLPILKQFDKTGGIVYGAFRGVMIVLVIFALISVFAPMISENTINKIEKSWIGSSIYNNNILLKIIT